MRNAVDAANVCMILKVIHMEKTMRTNIVIDDELMAAALQVSGLRTKREAVEEGLKLLIRRNEQQGVRDLRGSVRWEGDLSELRGGR